MVMLVDDGDMPINVLQIATHSLDGARVAPQRYSASCVCALFSESSSEEPLKQCSFTRKHACTQKRTNTNSNSSE